MPFLLFGPPGTGKTRTLVAAIVEIAQTTANCVLVCSQSNSACNEITERLAKFLETGLVLRLFAKSYSPDLLSKTIRPICNLKKEEFELPSMNFIQRFRVVVCTLHIAGMMGLSRGMDPDFKSNHFSHVILDEAAFVHEPATFLPIVGMCSEKEKIIPKIILSGDPEQLQPVTKSTFAADLGFKVSYMAYLFTRKCYQQDGNGQFDPELIVQLVKNYRNHPTILDISNHLIYKNRLEAKAPKGNYNRL